MPFRSRSLPLLLLTVTLFHPALARGQADHLVRATEARSAAEEQKGFKVPVGFSVQLFADETLLGGKPINMAFDARGRLWVSSTQEYPYAVPKDKWSPDTTSAPGSKDTIRILEDTDGDGRADKVTIFADNVNIPTGVLPYKNGCIAWSIPNVMYFEDTDGDGKSDKRTILLGPLGYEKDTHGMISSLRLGLDGWVYATHGFNNTSHVRASDGSTLDLHSGNTFRFQPDGSRVEIWTRGQVNPFGLCWDSRGNLYSADCHSSPIYQLIRGAYYPSFGKPHDGLGYAPIMCAHAHGSTGISGVVYLDGGVWGPEWDDHTFLGNPVTSRVNHDHVTFTGTTPKANELPDLLTSEDEWFRPVDLQLGPDSALYIADFYNRIIGHYEVPLDHPGRDRKMGRIWRVVKEGHTGKLTDCNLAAKDGNGLMQELASPNLTRRYLATGELMLRTKEEVLGLTRRAISSQIQADGTLARGYYLPKPEEIETGIQQVHAMWIAFRLGDENLPFQMARGLMGGGVHLEGNLERLSAACLRALGEKKTLVPDGADTEGELSALDAQFDSRGPFSMREAALAMSLQPSTITDVAGVLRPRTRDNGVNEVLDAGDQALLLAWRMAVRTWLSQAGAFAKLEKLNIATDRMLKEWAFIACAIPTSESAEWLLGYVKRSGTKAADLTVTLTHIARYLPAARQAELIALVQEHVGGELDAQLELYKAISEGQDKSGAKAGEALTAWAAQLKQRLLQGLQDTAPGVWRLATPPTEGNPNPWHPELRKCADGNGRVMLDSHPPGGEKLTGTYRSGTFDVPAKLGFWIAGHRGSMTAPPHEKNFVRLVDAGSGQELARAYPPRNDVAQPVAWLFATAAPGEALKEGELARGSGRAYFELTDGDTASSFAWLAVGGFEPESPATAMPANTQNRDAHLRVLAQMSRTAAKDDAARAFLTALPDKATFSATTRTALAEFLAASLTEAGLKPLVTLAPDAELAATVFEMLQSSEAAWDKLSQAFRTLPFRAQTKLATALSGSPAGAERLIKVAPARVLADPLVGGKIKALNKPEITKQVAEITSKLPPTNEAAKAIITARLKSYATTVKDEKRGQQVFQVNCAICHRIGVTGNLVGPQLDGIGVRGAERLLEDLLDPNRAVDPAFRLHFVKQKNGNLLTGLFRREADGTVYFADAAGQEHPVPKTDIVEDQVSDFSLMPAGFGELLPEKDLLDLLAYLLARK